MELPTKITPDNLKDTVVELRYKSKIPFEILLGFIFSKLDDTYHYSNRPLPFNDQLAMNPGEGVQLQIGTQKLFFTDKIKLELRPNILIFNCLEQYPGWVEYSAEIFRTLNQILSIKEIESVNRIGFRYISEYPNDGIKSSTNFEFTFGVPQIESDKFLFRSEFKWQTGDRVILTLQHKADQMVANLKNNSNELRTVSVIDIDIISDNLDLHSLEDIMSEVDRVHLIEKEFFFTLLRKEYLSTLNPTFK